MSQMASMTDPTKLRDPNAVFDEATMLFGLGEHRKAFVCFDICVSASPGDAKYRLSRGICAFKLQIYDLAIKDADESYRLHTREKQASGTQRFQSELPARLKKSIEYEDKRHSSRCRYWAGKGRLMLGDVTAAEALFTESLNLFDNQKAKEMRDECRSIKTQKRSTPAPYTMMLFYNQDHAPTTSLHTRAFHPYSVASSLPPDEEYLPVTIIGSHGVFEKGSYNKERLKRIKRAFREEEDRLNVSRSSILLQSGK